MMDATKARFEHLRRSTGAALCVTCGKCSTMCPEGSVADFSARRIVNQELYHHLDGSAVGVQRCLTCGSCELRCPQGVKISELVRGLRELLPEQDRRLRPHGGVFQTVPRMQAAGGASSKQAPWLDDSHRVAEKGELALFVGCLPLFDLYFQDSLAIQTLEIARSAVTIFNRLGVEPVIVDEEVCCGHDLLWSGDREGFASLAHQNAKLFADRGVKLIVTTCAECCRTWRLDYADEVTDYHPRVQHISEYLAEHIDDPKLNLATQSPTRVTIQDACRLGRHLNVVDAPREVLRAVEGTELVEMPRSGRDADCCGTSGFMHCDAQSKQLQRQRLRSAEATGASTITTSCPKCLIHFSCSKTEDEKCGNPIPNIEIMDFTVLVASSLVDRQEPNESPAPDERVIGARR